MRIPISRHLLVTMDAMTPNSPIAASNVCAGDLLQNVKTPSAYAVEVCEAVAREKFQPEKVAAMHILLSDWAPVDAMVKAGK
jgi:hypothetical protein